jgi:hypothetical protein
MKYKTALAGCLWVALITTASGAEPQPPDTLAVRIVPTTFREPAGRAITLGGPTQHFHVVVTNVSGNPIRVWREWCSWGYFTLSFQATDEAGKTTTVKKKDRGWDKNYPDWTTIPPGDHLVFEVSFDEATWQDPPLPEQGKVRTVRLRAIFEVPADQDTKASQIWTGKTLSPEDAYTIYR